MSLLDKALSRRAFAGPVSQAITIASCHLVPHPRYLATGRLRLDVPHLHTPSPCMSCALRDALVQCQGLHEGRQRDQGAAGGARHRHAGVAIAFSLRGAGDRHHRQLHVQGWWMQRQACNQGKPDQIYLLKAPGVDTSGCRRGVPPDALANVIIARYMSKASWLSR